MFQKTVVQKITTHISRSIAFVFECPAVYEKMKKNIKRGHSVVCAKLI
jgi:hypothetical protein